MGYEDQWTTVDYLTTVILTVVFVWVVFWVMASATTKEECVSRGAEYDHTSLLFTGYCKVNGTVVRLKGLGKD